MNNINNFSLPTFKGTETTTRKTTINEDLQYLVSLKSRLNNNQGCKRTKIYSETGDYICVDISNAKGEKIHMIKDREGDFLTITKTSPDGNFKHSRSVTMNETSDQTIQQRILDTIKEVWQTVKSIAK